MKPGFTVFLSAAALCLSFAAAAAAPERYVAPGGVFSIAAQDAAAPAFRKGKESKSADLVLADFPFVDSAGLAMLTGRTVEWVKLDKPLDPAQFDGQASALADGYLEGRYGAGAFTIGGSGKFRAADGRLIYVFAAAGTLDKQPARWQGVIQFFDHGIALVGETVFLPEGQTPDLSRGIISQAAIDWAQTLQPGT